MGVAGNVLDQRDREDPQDTWYLPYAQNAAGLAADEIHLMLRFRGDPAGLGAAVRAAVQRIDASLPVTNITTMDGYYRDTFERERIGASVTLAFGVFGLALGALGVYGVMAFTVAARTPEIALRLALGATPGRVLRLVLGRAGLLSGAGLSIGLLASGLLNRVLAGFIPEVRPLEPLVLAAASGVLFAASLLASYLPARRAAAVDPLAALRSE